MILEDDLVQEPVVKDSAGTSFPDDVIVGEKQSAPAGGRFLLVRELTDEGRDPNTPPRLETFELPNPPQRPIEMHRLTITSKAMAPDFKVFLFPYRSGQEIPKTTWNADHTVVILDWSDQRDVVSFAKAADGRTRISVTRGGKGIADVR